MKLRGAQQAPRNRPRLDRLLLLQLGPVVAERHTLDADDRDADVVADTRGVRGVEQRARRREQDAGLAAVHRVDDDLGVVERLAQPAAGGLVDREMARARHRLARRAAAEHADGVPGGGELSHDVRPGAARASGDRDLHAAVSTAPRSPPFASSHREVVSVG